jgi:hypothetical protein
MMVLVTISALAVLAITLTPNAVFASRTPFVVQNVSESQPIQIVAGTLQGIYVLPLRDDGKVYVGEITYTASLPVEVNVLQPKDESITTQAAGIPLTVEGGNATVSILGTLGGKHSDSLSFVGSSVLLLHRSTEPFTASYSVVGELADPEPLPK